MGRKTNQLRFPLLATLILSATALLPTQGAAVEAQDLPATTEARLGDDALKTAIMGALLFLDDTQIRQRRGLHDPRFDACSGDGCLPLVPGTGQALPLPLPFTNNRKGEWANFIHIFPDVLSPHNGENESIIQIQDSNMFMTTAITYPLYLFDESGLPEGQRTVTDVRRQAVASIRTYQAGDAFTFWPHLAGSSSDKDRVGPLNIPMKAGSLQNVFPSHRKPSGDNYASWSTDLFNPAINPYGVDALANIPADADDTALAAATLELAAAFDGDARPSAALTEELLKWRDLGRAMEDGRDTWKGKDSAGFLTWLKEENIPREERFMTPETGVIPLGVNNVDCVVNANALLALGLQGLAASAAANDVSVLMARAVEQHSWPECGLYYPQRMIFPYSLTRAYRDGGVRTPAMKEAMRRLLFDLLREQRDLAATNPKHAGAFSGGADPTYDLATGLALASLLNIGESLATEAGVLSDYQRAIAKAAAYLTAHQQRAQIKFGTTFNRDNDRFLFPNPRDKARKWDSGVFFSASNWKLAQWRSDAYTVAIVLEALAKYALAYEQSDESFLEGARLKVTSYGRNADDAPRNLLLTK
ncbi:MAG: hypothetical protein FJ146_10395 [Deltaproteobacteria bacterium]|nr:hypothetical protein [Deltaproteobacteria bacterium]